MADLIASIFHEHIHGFFFANDLDQGVMPADLTRYYPPSEAEGHGIPFLEYVALTHSNFRPEILSDLMLTDGPMGLRW